LSSADNWKLDLSGITVHAGSPLQTESLTLAMFPCDLGFDSHTGWWVLLPFFAHTIMTNFYLLLLLLILSLMKMSL